MEKEFNLSEKIASATRCYPTLDVIPTKQIKEFIKRVKEEIDLMYGLKGLQKFIDKLAGNKLLEER